MDLTRTAFGTWSGGRFMHFGEMLDDERFIALIRLAYDSGIRTFVTSDVYGNGRADEMLVQRGDRLRLVAVRRPFLEDLPVSGLLEVRRRREDQPQRIVVEPASDLVVAPSGQRLILVIGAARDELCRSEVENPRASSVRHHVHTAQQILVRIPKADSAADPRTVGGRSSVVICSPRARTIER